MSDSESEEDLDWAQLLDRQVLKRGEKDHAPDGTGRQQSALDRSRGAMYAVLAKPARSLAKQIVECDWDNEGGFGRVRSVKGRYFASMGWAERDTTFVWPEELCYLCERGSMVCYFDGEPLSVEGVLALAMHWVGADKMLVYAHLKKLGFVVRRDLPPKVVVAQLNKNPEPINWAQLGPQMPTNVTNLAWWLCGSSFSHLAWRTRYTQYSSVYRDLRCVRQTPLQYIDRFEAGKPFDFLVWKPATPFKRSNPIEADYRLKVVSADDPLPSIAEIGVELDHVAPKASTKRTVVPRMREGARSFMYAVVDNGVVSFLRVGEPIMECS